MSQEVNEYRAIREGKRDALAALGVNPYEVRTPERTTNALIRTEFETAEKAATADAPAALKDCAIAGRVLANRKMGKKAIFLDVYDGSGKLQVYMNEKGIGAQGMAIYENLDLGDFVWVKGDVQRTRTGEVTLFASELRFLTKALSVPPLPREFTDEEGNKKSVDALTDPEQRHRKRYLDLMVHGDVRARFEQRSTVVTTIRHYLEGERFLEVETPMMHPVPGGARARPFITHHNTLGMNLYLRIAPELYLKRLLVGGFERVFEINRNFRNEGIDHTHNPEFTMLELYEAYADYERMMELTQGMIVAAARAVRGNDDLKFNWNGHEIDLTPPFRRAKYGDLFQEAVGFEMTEKEKVAAEAKRLEIDPKQDYWNTVNEILEHHVEPKLIQPTFMIDYPTAICPLTKSKPDQPDIAERFELFIGGVEFANAFSELNEPVEQLRRFEEQVELGKASKDVEAPKEVDYDYVEALEAGMPPAGGLGVGIDRLVMLLTGTDSIREVILFPHMRREHVNQQDAAVQRARIAVESVLEELDSPELRKIEGLHQLAARFSELVEHARVLLGDPHKEVVPRTSDKE
ncbi:MAG: lysine--tRNA ligase [Planctomycetes bacterium]|nr:lysine--tRNA ligase [Planctomycetota bacterium]